MLNYEPHSALFPGPDDPLIFYRSIAALASRKMNPDGQLYLEINEKSAREVSDIIREAGFDHIRVIQRPKQKGPHCYGSA